MCSYQTRSKTEKQKMEETARILVQLSQGFLRTSSAPPVFPNASPHASPHASPRSCPVTPPATVLSNLDSTNKNPLKAPPAPVPVISRSLSHSDVAYQRTMEVAPYTKPGDTILMNWFMDRNQYTTLQYMKNEDGVMVIHHMKGPYSSINIPWTYDITDFQF